MPVLARLKIPRPAEDPERHYEQLRQLISKTCGITLPRPAVRWTPKLWSEYRRTVSEEEADRLADKCAGYQKPQVPQRSAQERKMQLLLAVKFLTGIDHLGLEQEPPIIQHHSSSTLEEFDDQDFMLKHRWTARSPAQHAPRRPPPRPRKLPPPAKPSPSLPPLPSTHNVGPVYDAARPPRRPDGPLFPSLGAFKSPAEARLRAIYGHTTLTRTPPPEGSISVIGPRAMPSVSAPHHDDDFSLPLFQDAWTTAVNAGPFPSTSHSNPIQPAVAAPTSTQPSTSVPTSSPSISSPARLGAAASSSTPPSVSSSSHKRPRKRGFRLRDVERQTKSIAAHKRHKQRLTNFVKARGNDYAEIQILVARFPSLARFAQQICHSPLLETEMNH